MQRLLWNKILTGQIFKINRFLSRSEVYYSNMIRLVFSSSSDWLIKKWSDWLWKTYWRKLTRYWKMFAAPLPRIFSMEKAAYPLGIVLYFVQKILQLYAFNRFENSLLLSVQVGFLQTNIWLDDPFDQSEARGKPIKAIRRCTFVRHNSRLSVYFTLLVVLTDASSWPLTKLPTFAKLKGPGWPNYLVIFNVFGRNFL